MERKAGAGLGYPKEVYDRAWQMMEQRAAQARQRGADRRRKVLRAAPEVAEIEREMAYQAAGITKTVLGAPDRAGELIEELAQRNLALQEMRGELLQKNGFAPDYLEEQFGCALCRDQGYVGARMCGCLQSLLEAEAYARLSDSAPVESCSFESFSLGYYPKTADAAGVSPHARMGDILAFCKSYAEGFSSASESLLLLGKTGLGKTHLSLAIAGAVTRKAYSVVYTPVQSLMDKLESDKFSYDAAKKEQYAGNVRSTVSCDLLVLDDLGTEFMTQFTSSTLYSIINSRLVSGRPTIVSTNLEMAEIEQKYSERMVSRLMGIYKVLKFTGRDVRLVKKGQGRA